MHESYSGQKNKTYGWQIQMRIFINAEIYEMRKWPGLH